MQERLLKQVPGLIGFDAPRTPYSTGRVVIEPSYNLEASAWLKRRFRVSENLELSSDGGLVLEIAPRVQRLSADGPRSKVVFGKPMQYELALV